jgi:hypothetical protein
MGREFWTLPALAKEWGVVRQTVRHYVSNCGLVATRDDEGVGHAYRVTDAERIRFNRDIRPTLKPGRTKQLPEGIVRRSLVDLVFPNAAPYTTRALAMRTIQASGCPASGFIITESVQRDHWIGPEDSPSLRAQDA